MEGSTPSLRWELLLLSHPGHQVERFLEAEDARKLTFVSKLLRLSRRLPRHRPGLKVHAFPHAEAREWTAAKVHAVLSRDYYASRGRRKPNQRHGRLTLAQLTVLMDQILLVSSGIRTACLIDHCRLDPDLATFLLETLDYLCVLSSQDDVAALFLGGNAFFVSVPLFLQDKALEIASDFRDLLVVNAAASLETPTLAPTVSRVDSSDSSNHDKPGLVNLLTDAMLSLCKALLGARCAEPPRRVVEWEPRSQLSRTAIAGMILCYPVVYDVSDGSEPAVMDGACSDWIEQENCLAMCPLVVVQTSLRCTPARYLTRALVPC
jgi:hypothetical protein